MFVLFGRDTCNSSGRVLDSSLVLERVHFFHGKDSKALIYNVS